MGSIENIGARGAAVHLAASARGVAPKRWRAALRWLAFSVIDRPVPRDENTIIGWRDVPCYFRRTWRTRHAMLDGDIVFGVDYKVCRDCEAGWVDEPHTYPDSKAAGWLPRRSPRWRTLGGHFREAVGFWQTVSVRVPGGFSQRKRCTQIINFRKSSIYRLW